jgi:hypothetical protein
VAVKVTSKDPAAVSWYYTIEEYRPVWRRVDIEDCTVVPVAKYKL